MLALQFIGEGLVQIVIEGIPELIRRDSAWRGQAQERKAARLQKREERRNRKYI